MPVFQYKAKRFDGKTLLESGLHKVIQGITSIEEIFRTCMEED